VLREKLKAGRQVLREEDERRAEALARAATAALGDGDRTRTR
jgi:hypothetical protein